MKALSPPRRDSEFRKTHQFHAHAFSLVLATFLESVAAFTRIFRSFQGVRILITGITGAIGSELAPHLLSRGHEVRGLVRDAGTARARGEIAPEVELVQGDASIGAGLDDACAGVEVAYYLLHSMEPLAARARFATVENAAAAHFARAAAAARVRRVVYFGAVAPRPGAGAVSAHMASRLRVERVVLGAAPESLALRASIVIGARSRSFRLLVRLIERMPVLVLPAWHERRTAPIDQRDVSAALVSAASAPLPPAEAILDLAGPEVVSYGCLIARIRDAMLLDRPIVSLRHLSATPIASRLSALIAGERHELVGPLMESLGGDLLASAPDTAATYLGIRRHRLDAAIEHALAQWERGEALRAR